MMNKLPEDLPPLPEGAVPLGFGGEFVIPENQRFDGYMWEFGDENWFAGNMVNGKYQDIFYAAPANSEIARLNGLDNNKPSWDDAPDWAEWLAQDKDGKWAWFREPPHFDQNGSKTWIVSNPNDQPLPTWVKAGSGKTNPNWRKTLEPKPDSKHQRTSKSDILIPFGLFDWSSIPAMLDEGYRLEIDRHGLRGYKDEN